ncbi:hypothetical protein [Sphingobacterium humi]|uniref:Uncharacterized protein n=1 Tax=Sphingobacterium humi TaxID=1796905 RepID=A0A6N8KUE4_9SPHI|nr:hypothetical protein [Sphingobacterium humi]MVZ60686.1 hypothetical protein [Sphingobacterium humi]
MKNVIKTTLLLGVLLASCQKDFDATNDPTDEVGNISIGLSKDSARSAFSKILSKAVFNEPELRNFIKSTAIDEFDNDQDVFYPFVRDEMVSEGKTFREILDMYSENKEILLQIEEALPLLNIYVPDLTAFFKFNAEHWDTSDKEIVVTALNQNNDPHVFYGNGERMFTLDKNEIPGFPCLVIKNNERVKLKNDIKVKGVSSKSAYEFVADAFDKKLKTKSLSNSTENRTLTLGAWSEFGVHPDYWQRDYIYYGMSRSNS